jgi:hypothetical protein
MEWRMGILVDLQTWRRKAGKKTGENIVRIWDTNKDGGRILSCLKTSNIIGQ